MPDDIEVKNGRLKISLAALGGLLLTLGGIVLVFGMRYGALDNDIQDHEGRIQKVENAAAETSVKLGRIETMQAVQMQYMEKMDQKLDRLNGGPP